MWPVSTVQHLPLSEYDIHDEGDILSINKAAKSWLDSVDFYFCGRQVFSHSRSEGCTIDQHFSLKNVAEKEGVLCDLVHYSKFISPAASPFALPASSKLTTCCSLASLVLVFRPQTNPRHTHQKLSLSLFIPTRYMSEMREWRTCLKVNTTRENLCLC